MNINVNSLEADTALALYPLHLPGSIQTVQPPGYADRGVPLSIYSATQPLAIVVDPLVMLANSKNGALGGVLEAYDTVTVWVNGVATGASDYVKPGKESERMLFHLQPGWFNDGVNTMRYRVERLSGNYEDSLTLDVLYYTPASGVTVSHPSSVSPGQTGPITITISYPRPFGTVTLTIGTWSITFTNFDHTKPIIYPLTIADIQQIGNGTHPLNTTVRDQLSNISPVFTSTIDVSLSDNLDEDFERYSERYFPIGEKVELQSMFVTALSGTHPPQILHRDEWSPVLKGKRLYAVMNRTGTTQLEFKAACSLFQVGV